MSRLVRERCPSTGKISYRHPNFAAKVLRKMRAQGEADQPLPVRSYRCPDCGYWHLTSKPARRMPLAGVPKRKPPKGRKAGRKRVQW